MQELDDHLARVDLGVLENLRHSIYWSSGNSNFSHPLKHFSASQWSQRAIDDRSEVIVVGQACIHPFKPRIGCELWKPEHAAEIRPLFLVRHSDVDESILRLKRFI